MCRRIVTFSLSYATETPSRTWGGGGTPRLAAIAPRLVVLKLETKTKKSSNGLHALGYDQEIRLNDAVTGSHHAPRVDLQQL